MLTEAQNLKPGDKIEIFGEVATITDITRLEGDKGLLLDMSETHPMFFVWAGPSETYNVVGDECLK